MLSLLSPPPPPPLCSASRLFTELKAAEEREKALLGYWRQLQVPLKSVTVTPRHFYYRTREQMLAVLRFICRGGGGGGIFVLYFIELYVAVAFLDGPVWSRGIHPRLPPPDPLFLGRHRALGWFSTPTPQLADLSLELACLLCSRSRAYRDGRRPK